MNTPPADTQSGLPLRRHAPSIEISSIISPPVNLRTTISDSISEGVKGFAKHIKGFDMEDAVFSGVESRTSSPVRIIRNENCESDIKGLFPCGEGAGYAGGITSAAVDGMKVAERIASEYIKKVTI